MFHYARGLDRSEIADVMHMTVRTYDTHIRHILLKLDVASMSLAYLKVERTLCLKAAVNRTTTTILSLPVPKYCTKHHYPRPEAKQGKVGVWDCL